MKEVTLKGTTDGSPTGGLVALGYTLVPSVPVVMSNAEAEAVMATEGFEFDEKDAPARAKRGPADQEDPQEPDTGDFGGSTVVAPDSGPIVP